MNEKVILIGASGHGKVIFDIVQAQGDTVIGFLDDSASALDYATDAKLRMAIRNMENPPTTFIVSQRAASVRFADLILVLDEGDVVGMGTHEELLESCAVYQEIYYSQFPREVKGNG